MDLITSTDFSVDINTLNNPNGPFVSRIKQMVEFDFLNSMLLISVLFLFIIPLLEKMNVSFFLVSVTDFLSAALEKIKADRVAKNHTDRVDFLQLMVDSQILEKRGDKDKGLNDHKILSQSISFMMAGYEMTSSTLSFFYYNIATNPDTMNKLQEEIDLPQQGSLRRIRTVWTPMCTCRSELDPGTVSG
ncbi:cytochrome P450 3A30-like [Hoplias malabaricus]|uniref:cytochrome P450 3A30-like n=1 Tax=Hoplias malabaricus TaxID=27720 RepID=UPI0034625BCB